MKNRGVQVENTDERRIPGQHRAQCVEHRAPVFEGRAEAIVAGDCARQEDEEKCEESVEGRGE